MIISFLKIYKALSELQLKSQRKSKNIFNYQALTEFQNLKICLPFFHCAVGNILKMKTPSPIFVILLVLVSTLFVASSTKINSVDKVSPNVHNKDSIWPIDPIYFTCLGKDEGYYADHYRGCKVFHYCKPDGSIMSFACPEDFIFDDDSKICGPPSRVQCAPYDPSNP